MVAPVKNDVGNREERVIKRQENVEYAQNQNGKNFDGKYDWSVFEKEDNTNGKVTGLKVLMKAYGKAKVVS